MDYATIYLQVIVRYHVSDIILNIDSDAAYLALLDTKSQRVGYFYLTSNPLNTLPPINTQILVICKTFLHKVEIHDIARDFN